MDIEADVAIVNLWRYAVNSSTYFMLWFQPVIPEMSGGEAFNVMKEINPDIRVLVSSGYSINGEARDLLTPGAKGFIQKPFRKSEISQKIAEVLEFAE